MAFLFSMRWICTDGKMVEENTPVIRVSNRGFRYGDGLFETMRWEDGRIRLELYHMERLFTGMLLMGIHPETISEENIHTDIARLIKANGCGSSAKVRLAIYRNENHSAGYVLEADPLSPGDPHNPWKIDIYPYARKSADAFSNLKSANYLPYVMAGNYARSQHIDEAIVLNSSGRICDGSKTNVFLVHNDQLSTPALFEGCVNGVMRRHILTSLKERGLHVEEGEITEEKLRQVDEIFLTNAIMGIQPVSHFREKKYSSEFTNNIFADLRF